MVIERADIAITPGREIEFEAAMTRGVSLLSSAAGAGSVSLMRCLERGGRYMLQIEWNAISDHEAFTKTPEFQEFRSLAGPFFGERPSVEHYQRIQ